MSNKAFIVLCFLFLSIAQGEDIVNWAGTWDVTSQASDTACYPDDSIVITQDIGTVTASWTWATTQPCVEAGLAGKAFTQTAKDVKGNSISLNIVVGTAVVSGTFTVNKDTARFASNLGASANYARRAQMVSWEGTWDVATQDPTACNPNGFITITQTSTQVAASWTWSNSDVCKQIGLAGKSFTTSVDTPKGNAIALTIVISEQAALAEIFAVVRDQAVFASITGAASTFARRVEKVNFVGTWQIKTQESVTSCYPNSTVVITESKGNIVASWQWADSTPCTLFGLAGANFTQTQPTPKGKAAFIDVFVGLSYVSGLFIVNGEQATFASANGASATFDRIAGSPTSWTWLIILIILLGVAIGAFLFYKKKQEKETEDPTASLTGIYTKN